MMTTDPFEEVATDLVAQLAELIRHCYIHSGYRKCGYMQMTTKQKELFDSVTNCVNQEILSPRLHELPAPPCPDEMKCSPCFNGNHPQCELDHCHCGCERLTKEFQCIENHEDFLPSNRPKDVDGDYVLLGKWYWMMNRTGQIAGTGKFLVTISRPAEIAFYINGTGYSHETMKFAKAGDPERLFSNEQAR